MVTEKMKAYLAGNPVITQTSYSQCQLNAIHELN